MMVELCGHPTRSGKPCNMKKGHNANFHRHRDYPTPMAWVIENRVHKIVEEGSGREELGYAITRHLDYLDNLVVRITRSVPVGS